MVYKCWPEDVSLSYESPHKYFTSLLNSVEFSYSKTIVTVAEEPSCGEGNNSLAIVWIFVREGSKLLLMVSNPTF